MLPKPELTDRKALLDLWKASKPRLGEHRLAFSINFSTDESDRLKKQGRRYITEAHRTIRDLLRTAKPTAIVVIVERNRRLTMAPHGPTTDLHAHGWVRIKKTETADLLQAKLYKTQSPKITAKSGFFIQDTYIDQASKKVKPLDTGWVEYISKNFGRTPTGCQRPRHFFSASKHAKSKASEIRKNRKTRLNNLVRVFRREDRMIKRNEGEWKYFSKAHADYYIQPK